MKISSFSLLIRYSVYEVTLHVPILFCNHPASVLTDKSKPEETAKCKFLIVHRLVLQGHTLDCSHVFCQLAGEGDVCFVLFIVLGHRKPCISYFKIALPEKRYT